MKLFRAILICFFAFFTLVAFAQTTYTLSGILTDADTGEPLIGATVSTASGIGTLTDFDGSFSLLLEEGAYAVTYSYVGYTPKTDRITISRDMRVKIELNTIFLNEVLVTADIAKERETPVAFSNIPGLKIREELASQDLPMILNSTPGAYATQTGGGDGDARVTIRGFNQRNVAVMLDGIPVNDMENGWVYWSNWFGLDLVTQTIQVQRGLGASKLSIPSVGGTINILTKGIDAKKGISLQQEAGNDNFLRTTLGLTSGRLKSGWAISAAGSYKQGDGWVDGTFTEGYFYYLRIDKQLGDHLMSLQGFGAPQRHGQRSYTMAIPVVDVEFARELGFTEEEIFSNDNYLGVDRGRKYNQHWGFYDGELYNTRQNYYHKPQFNLRHSWQPNDKVFWSNIAYLSLGSGGGTGTEGRFQSLVLPDGQLNLDTAAILNASGNFLKPAGKSERIIRASVNNHFWYGFLSTLKYDFSNQLTVSVGLDGRYYRGDHYREVYDLLGGDYFTGVGNLRIDQADTPLGVGDKYDYNNSGFVRWFGGFGLAEWKNERWSVFANVSGAVSGYRMEDFMKAKVVDLPDTTLYVSYGKAVSYNGETYSLDAPQAQNQKIDWVDIPSYTFKTGAAYNLNISQSVFFNTGYLSRAQRFTNVINDARNNPRAPIRLFENYENEIITAFEAGYSFSSTIFSANVNAYFTNWENKPLDFPVLQPLPDNPEELIPVNIPGIDARHTGVEVDFAFRPISKLTLEGLASIGDWRWNSSEVATIILEDYDTEVKYEFDAKGVHVGDAAQTQLGGLIRYEPIRGFYVKMRGTYFGRNYANFRPESLQGTNGGRDSWLMPQYAIFDAHTGYRFQWQKTKMTVRLNVLNVFDAYYISDASNNDDRTPGVTTRNFDAPSASVFFGQGRRWSVALQVEL